MLNKDNHFKLDTLLVSIVKEYSNDDYNSDKQNKCINNLCLPESCNTNLSHQLFDYKTFVNSQHKKTN